MSEWYIEHSQGPWKEHKYIRIDKIKGVPRYIYNKAGGSAKRELEKADAEYKEADKQQDEAEQFVDNYVYDTEEMKKRGAFDRETGKYIPNNQAAENALQKQADKQLTESYKNYQEKGKAASEAAKAYYKTPLGKAEHVVSKAKDAGSFVKSKGSDLVSKFKSYSLFSGNTSAKEPTQTKSTVQTTSNRPKSRERAAVSGQGSGVYKRGSGLDLGGKVGTTNLKGRKR